MRQIVRKEVELSLNYRVECEQSKAEHGIWSPKAKPRWWPKGDLSHCFFHQGLKHGCPWSRQSVLNRAVSLKNYEATGWI